MCTLTDISEFLGNFCYIANSIAGAPICRLNRHELIIFIVAIDDDDIGIFHWLSVCKTSKWTKYGIAFM